MPIGPMQYGANNDAGADETGLVSNAGLLTLKVVNNAPNFDATGIRGEGPYTGVEGIGPDILGGTGVYGRGGRGVHGYSPGGDGVVGHSDTGNAGRFRGKVTVVGDLEVRGCISESCANFVIDHPRDPGNKYLSHAQVHSPEALNVYSGTVTTDGNGTGRVELPEYFDDLNEDVRYQLTVIGQFAQAIVAEEMNGNQFTIRTDKPNVKVSWQVCGVRKDPFWIAHRRAVEENKPQEERGKYLHPEAYGRPATDGVDYTPQQELKERQRKL